MHDACFTLVSEQARRFAHNVGKSSQTRPAVYGKQPFVALQPVGNRPLRYVGDSAYDTSNSARVRGQAYDATTKEIEAPQQATT